MGDNSLDWQNALGGLSDSDELMSMIINDSKAEKPRDDPQEQESRKIILQPAALPNQNNHVVRDVEPASSSWRTQNLQTRMITAGGCLVNPFGFIYRSQKMQQVAPAAAPSESGTESSQELLTPCDKPVNKSRRKSSQGALGDAERKKMIKIKNRISAAKSRAKRHEHTKSLEQEVELLKTENAHLKKLLGMSTTLHVDQEDGARDKPPAEEGQETTGKRQNDVYTADELLWGVGTIRTKKA